MNTQEIIDALCKSKGYRKSKIEDELELGSGYLSRVRNPSLDKLQKIAEYFGVTVDYLMTGKEPEFSKEQVLLDLRISQDLILKSAIEKYYSLSEKKQKHVIELIELLAGEE